ncbi:MAG: MarR family transcriptional regulator [Mesorhizobium sp.]|nr:MAG: MarR family transcriptional regulator [Mesorhizobium sp.]
MVSDGIDRLGFLIHDVQRLMRKRFEARASGLGLSSAQWRPISVSRLVDRMEEGGWIERRADAADRRVRMIFPTEKANAAYADVKSLAGEVYEESLTGVSLEDRRILIRVLDTIVQNLTDGETSSLEKIKNTEGRAA